MTMTKKPLTKQARIEELEANESDLLMLLALAQAECRELKARIADLEAQLAAIGAGGMEPVRGQAGFEAWWRDKYPSFACHAPGIWEMAMHHAALQAAQPARAAAAVPEGWTACRIEHEPGYPEDVAFGPQIMMDRLKKWLDRHFAALAAAPAQADEVEALTDMPDTARPQLEMLRDALGVPVEPHQCLFERMLEAATPAAQAQEHATQLAGQGQDVQQDKLDAARYRWLAPRLMAADFDWNETGKCALIFEWPANVGFGGHCDQHIDAAMAAQQEGGKA